MKDSENKKNSIALSLLTSIAVATIFFLGNCFLFYYNFHNQQIAFNQLTQIILTQGQNTNIRQNQQNQLLNTQGKIQTKLNTLNKTTLTVADKTQKVLKTANLAKNLISNNAFKQKNTISSSQTTNVKPQVIIVYKKIPVYVYIKVRVPVLIAQPAKLK